MSPPPFPKQKKPSRAPSLLLLFLLLVRVWGSTRLAKVGEFFGDALVEFSFTSAAMHDFASGDWLVASRSSGHPLLPGALPAQVVDVQPSKIPGCI